MATVIALSDFIGQNRDELIARCRSKVTNRVAPAPTRTEIDHGAPLFLAQLCDELNHGRSSSHEISNSATQHGHDLLLQGFTISQVVHDYGDICQSVTDLAVEKDAPIRADDFRTLNRCLDDAIASAVTEYARAIPVPSDGQSLELVTLSDTAITAFEVLQKGTVGIAGSTGAVLYRSLQAIRALAGRPPS
jgi:hypothetical protein